MIVAVFRGVVPQSVRHCPAATGTYLLLNLPLHQVEWVLPNWRHTNEQIILFNRTFCSRRYMQKYLCQINRLAGVR